MGTPVKHASAGQVALRNLSGLEEPLGYPDDQGFLTYIKNLAAYVWDLAAIFLGFARDAEASALVLSEDLDRLSIQTEAAHGSLGQDKDTEQKHGNLWRAIRGAVELSHEEVRRSHSHQPENSGI